MNLRISLMIDLIMRLIIKLDNGSDYDESND